MNEQLPSEQRKTRLSLKVREWAELEKQQVKRGEKEQARQGEVEISVKDVHKNRIWFIWSEDYVGGAPQEVGLYHPPVSFSFWVLSWHQLPGLRFETLPGVPKRINETLKEQSGGEA